MTDQVDTIEIRDTDAHEGQIQTMFADAQGVVKIVNTLDQAVTVTLETTTFEDRTVSNPVDRYEKEVAAGAIDYIRVGESWLYLRPVAQCAISPSSGSVKMVWNFR